MDSFNLVIGKMEALVMIDVIQLLVREEFYPQMSFKENGKKYKVPTPLQQRSQSWVCSITYLLI